MKKYLLLAVISAIVLCSCGEENTIKVQESIPTTVSKLAKSNSFDSLTVIQDEDYMYVYEKEEYKKSIPLTQESPGTYIILGIVLGLVVFGILAMIFSD